MNGDRGQSSNFVPRAETPYRSTSISQTSSHSKSLTKPRELLFEFTNDHAIEDTVSSWFDHYTPASKDPDLAVRVRHVIERLKTKRPSLLNSKGWNGLVNQTRDEDTTFAQIEVITKAISNILSKDLNMTPHTTLVCATRKMKSELEGGSMQSDGQFRLNTSSTPTAPKHDRHLRPRLPHTRRIFYGDPNDMDANTSDAAGIFQAKPSDTTDQLEITENQKKILRGGSHVLSNDPCRLFVFGLTIEHHTMRFWYFSRSHVAVSEGFDYHKHPEHFITFLIFLMFATPQQLGYDPSVRCVSIPEPEGAGEELVYEYRVADEWYRTTDIIQADRALDIVTRALRIWKVRKIVQDDVDASKRQLGDETYVLKDFWPFEDVQGEYATQQMMYERLRLLDANDGGTRELESRQYFMTILHDEPVEIDGQPTMLCHGRTHWRTLYKEVCKDLYTETSPSLYFKALSTVVNGLKFLRIAEMVHRDLSPGNVLLFGSDAKISDLEDCRQYIQTGTAHDPLSVTGTPGFIAVEVLAEEHCFDDTRIHKFFSHNFLHDLESVIWMALYFLYHQVPEPLSSKNHLQLLDDLWIESSKLFAYELMSHRTRTKVIEKPTSIQVIARLKAVYEKLPEMQEFLEAVLELRIKLGVEYTNLEASDPVVTDNVQHWSVERFRLAFYDELASHLLHCSELVQDVGLFSSLAGILENNEKASPGSLEEKGGGKGKQCAVKSPGANGTKRRLGGSSEASGSVKEPRLEQRKRKHRAVGKSSSIQATATSSRGTKRKPGGASRPVKEPGLKKSDVSSRRSTRLQEQSEKRRKP